MKAFLKGLVAETVTNVVTWALLDNTIYHRLNNVTLTKQNGMTTQIDHIIVSRYGIFVIETKNYKGWIFGTEHQEKWTQVLFGGKKFQFYNPIRQNYGHIKTLIELLQLDESCFHSIISFAPYSKLKNKDQLPDFVMNSRLISYIKNKKQLLLSEQQVLNAVETIKNSQIDNKWSAYFQHCENVQRHVQAKSLHPHCPHCQSPMVKRTAKKGPNAEKEFWGCSRYPHCRGTRDVA